MLKKLAKSAIKKISSGDKIKYTATIGGKGFTREGSMRDIPKVFAGKKLSASSREALMKKVQSEMKKMDRAANIAKKTSKFKDTIRKPEYAYLTGVGAGGALGYQAGKMKKNKKKSKPTTIMAARKKRTSKG
tara:strand:- start:3013 stop:3408 length:396 start_codon:yes stop_codon:yes gene_type:complete